MQIDQYEKQIKKARAYYNRNRYKLSNNNIVEAVAIGCKLRVEFVRDHWYLIIKAF